MAQYCVNTQAQSNGDHEVHNLSTCTRLPKPEHRKALGDHSTCRTAVNEAKKTYPQSNGCYYCSPDCNTG
jgi:hypothetical protein